MNPLLAVVASDKPLLLEGLPTTAPDAALLDFAVRDAAPAAGPMRVLELGAWIGHATLHAAASMASHAPAGGTIFAAGRWTADTRATDLRAMYRDDYLPLFRLSQNDLAYDIFRHNIRFVPDGVAVHTLRGPEAALAAVLTPGFDLILVNTSPYMEEAVLCLEAARRLVRDGGLILATKAQLPAEIAGFDLCKTNEHRAWLYHPELRMDFHPGASLALHRIFPGILPIAEVLAVRRRGERFLSYTPEPGPYRIPSHLKDSPSHFPYRDGATVTLRRWNTLRTTSRPLWLYGSGEAGQRACMFARAAGVTPAGFVDTYRRGSQMGLPIIGLEDLLAKGQGLDVVIATLHWPAILPTLSPLRDSRIFVSILPAGDAMVEALTDKPAPAP